MLLFEGQARWIMERETPEERIAALEVLMAIAFPNEGEEYKPPKSPKTNIGKVQRDAYNIFKDFSESRMWEWPGENQKKIVSEAHGTRIQNTEPMFALPLPPNLLPADPTAEEAEAERMYEALVEQKKNIKLSPYDKEKIAEWNKKIPNSAALKEYLERNYMFANRNLVCSQEFCDYAYNRLANQDMWISSKTKHPLKDLKYAIHYMAIEYMKISGEIRRAEQEEHKKDLDTEFAIQASEDEHRSPSELADIERRRARRAEKEAMEKILKGEL